MNEPITLPRGTALFKQAVVTYKAHVGTLLPLALVPALCGLSMQLAISLLQGSSPMSHLWLLPVGLIAVVLSVWFSLALLYAIVDIENPRTVVQILGYAGERLVPFLWVSILGILLVLAGIVAAAIPAGIVFALAYHAMGLARAGIVAAAVGGILAIVMIVTLAFWFMFSGWFFAEAGARGIAALKQSRALVKGRISVLLPPIIVLGFYMFLIGFVAGFPLGFIGALLHVPSTHMQAISSSISQILTTPLMAIGVYHLYRALKDGPREA